MRLPRDKSESHAIHHKWATPESRSSKQLKVFWQGETGANPRILRTAMARAAVATTSPWRSFQILTSWWIFNPSLVIR